MKKIFALLIISSFFLLISCNNLPSESTAETDVKSSINEKYNDNIELIEFTKTNAMEKDAGMFGGGKYYEIEFTGKIKFLNEAYNSSSLKYRNDLLFYEFKKPEKLSWQTEVDFEKSFEIISKNEIKEISGTVNYVKKENGWEQIKNDDGKKIARIEFLKK